MINIFGVFNFSILQVRNCKFQSSHYGYLRVITASSNIKSMFTNCTFTETNGFEVSHNSDLHLISSLIAKTTNTWQSYALIEISDNSHLYISNSSFIKNVLQRNYMTLIASNSSLTICNCVYTRNTMNYHIAISGDNATIVNTRFDNNYVTRAGSGGLLVGNGTTFILDHSIFNNNIIYGDVASLITLSANLILIEQCVISNNFLDIGFVSFHVNPFIMIYSSKCICLISTIISNNRKYVFTGDGFQAILTVTSANRIPGKLCSDK